MTAAVNCLEIDPSGKIEVAVGADPSRATWAVEP
jgi:hypothetical protein